MRELHGCRVLGGANDIAYQDGSEEQLLRIISEADDLSALSDELESQAVGWAQTYHLSRQRSCVLRALELPADAAVLEIGAGCGAITRYLGESCAVVDAVEPMLDRARVARARTRDLDNVEVFVGTIDGVPAEPTYDLVVVCGVLEYVGSGVDDPHLYIDFLERSRALLRPGGTLACAIENQLGVKYLSGAGEDHVGRPFDGVEGYRGAPPARTFARAELESLFTAAGLEATVLHAFPDYKLTRAVLADGIFADPVTSPLAWRIPTFPSPDRTGTKIEGPDERHLWRTLVQSGLGPQFANSFLVVAHASSDAEPAIVWPGERLAAYFSMNRRKEFVTQTVVARKVDGVSMLRTRLCDHRTEVKIDDLSLHVDDSAMVDGVDLAEYVSSIDDTDLADILIRWRHLVQDAVATADPDSGVPIDLIPTNVMVTESCELHAIDQEWFRRGGSAESVLRRGIVWFAIRVAELTSPVRWPGCATTRDVALRLGRMIGLDEASDWIDKCVASETEFQADVQSTTAPGLGALTRDQVIAAFSSDLEAMLDLSVHDWPLGDQRRLGHAELRTRLSDVERDAAEQRRTVAELSERLASMTSELTSELSTTQRELEAAHQRFHSVVTSRGWRILERCRSAVRWLR